MISVSNVVLILLGIAALIVSWMNLKATRRQPLAESELRAAEKLADLADTTKRALLEVARGYGAKKEETNEQGANVLSAWKEETASLEQRLGVDLKGRIASVTVLIESALRLGLFEDFSWVQACSWSCSDLRLAADARAQRQKHPAHLFPGADELRQLLSTGQSLGTGLDEVNRWCNENALRVIAHDEQKNQKRAALAGAGMGGGAALLLWGIAETFK